MQMKSKYDWTALMTEFVTGDVSVSALAKKHSIKYATLYRHYKNENWEAIKKAQSESLPENLPKSSDKTKMIKEIDIADKLLGVLDEAINDKKQFYRYIVKEKNGPDSGEEERVFGKMDMQALNNAIKALDSLQEIKRVVTGVLSPIEERKLLLAESKTINTDGEERETGVVILPEVEDEK